MENGKSHTQFQRYEPCAFNSYKNRELKVKKKAREIKKSASFVTYFVRRKFF